MPWPGTSRCEVGARRISAEWTPQPGVHYRDRTFPFGKERPFGNLGAVMRRWMAFLLICTVGAEAFPAQSIARAGALKVLP